MNEPKNKMSLALAFETAMIDAINIYVRTVLYAHGYLPQVGYDASSNPECLDAKYKIARELATKWATFDGYDRGSPASCG